MTEYPKDLLIACKRYWEARREKYDNNTPGITRAKLEMYEVMRNLWGPIARDTSARDLAFMREMERLEE